MVRGFIELLNEWQWHARFKYMHSGLLRQEWDSSRLRLVLGVGRSGTTWISKTLARSETPLRFFSEPLYHIEPKLGFSRQFDHTAIEYYAKLADKHPLPFIYSSFTASNYDWPYLGLTEEFILRNDDDWKYCLVKEVHSVLATEALTRNLDCTILFVVRDPVYVVDSIMAAHGLSTPYLVQEYLAVQRGKFLSKFAPDRLHAITASFVNISQIGSDRIQRILSKMLTVALINISLHRTADSNPKIKLIDYETICETPLQVFKSITDFFGLMWSDGLEDFIRSTSSRTKNEDDPYSIHRKSDEQISRPLKFLSKSEADVCYKLLKEVYYPSIPLFRSH